MNDVVTSEAVVVLELPRPATAKQLRKWRAKAAVADTADVADVADTVIEAVLAADAGSRAGAMVHLSHVRRRVVCDKQTFDATVDALVRGRRMYVHCHDFPSSLTPAQRDDMVVLGGKHYHAVSLPID